MMSNNTYYLNSDSIERCFLRHFALNFIFKLPQVLTKHIKDDHMFSMTNFDWKSNFSFYVM